MPSKYRDEYQAEVDRSRRENDIKLKALLSDSTFAEAATRGEGPSKSCAALDETAIGQAARVAVDRAADTQIRLIALNALAVTISQRRDLFDLILDLMATPEDDVRIRKLALNLIQQSSFGSPFFDQSKGLVLDRMRGIVQNTEEDQELRSLALSFLAGQGDDFAQHVLTEGLKDASQAVVSAARALQLLSADSHAHQPALLRQYASDKSHPESREIAVRMLARDADSRDLLMGLLQDKSEDAAVRQACAVALRSTSPDTYQGIAKQIVLDSSESDELRATLLNALGTDQAAKQASDPDFRSGIEQLRSSPDQELRKSSERYFRNSAED